MRHYHQSTIYILRPSASKRRCCYTKSWQIPWNFKKCVGLGALSCARQSNNLDQKIWILIPIFLSLFHNFLAKIFRSFNKRRYGHSEYFPFILKLPLATGVRKNRGFIGLSPNIASTLLPRTGLLCLLECCITRKSDRFICHLPEVACILERGG